MAAEDHVPSCPYSLQLGLQSKLQDKLQSHTEKPKNKTKNKKKTTILGFELKMCTMLAEGLISGLGWYSALKPAKAQNYSSTHILRKLHINMSTKKEREMGLGKQADEQNPGCSCSAN